ncbi:MAG: FAD-dependent oxidoreductase, partial [Acidobacteriota bacterium]
IIGGGAAGFGAAKTLLDAGCSVRLFESAAQLGGHCHSVTVRDRWGSRHCLDAGVSDFNRHTFTQLSTIIDELGLETHPIRQDTDIVDRSRTSMLSVRDGEWRFDPAVEDSAALLAEVDAFRAAARRALKDPRSTRWTVDRFLDHLGASKDFRRLYVLPRTMGAFPMPDGEPGRSSLHAILNFWRIHGLLGDGPADRRAVAGGMHRYAGAFERWLRRRGASIHTHTRVVGVARGRRHQEVSAGDRGGKLTRHRVDHVLFACHASKALELIERPSPAESDALSRFPHQWARVVVHRDPTLLGADRGRWGAFNYAVPDGDWPHRRPTVTFYPNRLASLDESVPDTFVTVNPVRPPRPDRILSDRRLLHPILNADTRALASRVEALQGVRRTWFAGAYLRAPAVHESALQSGADAARRLLQDDVEASSYRCVAAGG